MVTAFCPAPPSPSFRSFTRKSSFAGTSLSFHPGPETGQIGAGFQGLAPIVLCLARAEIMMGSETSGNATFARSMFQDSGPTPY